MPLDPTTHAVVEYLKVHDLGANAIAANAGSADFVNITIRYNEVLYFIMFVMLSFVSFNS